MVWLCIEKVWEWLVEMICGLHQPHCTEYNVHHVWKRRDQNVFITSSIKLWAILMNLIHSFLNKFSAKSYKRFPPHLSNVSTLPCETWNARCARATTELSEKVAPKFILPQLWPPNSTDLNPVTYSMWEYCRRRCTKHASITDLDLLTTQLTNDWRNDDMIQLEPLRFQLLFQFIQISDEYLEHNFHTLKRAGFKSDEFGGHS